MNKLSPTRISWGRIQCLLIYGAAAVLSLSALQWFYVFLFTNYRRHHRPVMIPLALATAALAFCLFRLSSTAVILLLALSALAGAGALYIQIFGERFHPFLASVVAGAVLYFAVLIPHFIKRNLK